MTITATMFGQESNGVSLKVINGGNHEGVLFKRTLPTRTKDFPGMEKGQIKLTTYTPTGEVQGIYTINSSVRADATAAQKMTDKDILERLLNHEVADQLLTNQLLPRVDITF